MSAVMATLLPLTYNMRAAAAVGAAQRAVDAERRARAVEVALAKSASMSMLGRAPTASASWLESAASAAAAAGGWCGGGVGGGGSLRGGVGSLGLSASVPALGLGSVPAPGLEGRREGGLGGGTQTHHLFPVLSDPVRIGGPCSEI